jgi:hypothetical protein
MLMAFPARKLPASNVLIVGWNCAIPTLKPVRCAAMFSVHPACTSIRRSTRRLPNRNTRAKYAELPNAVQKPVSERVKAIREEIADIREANLIAVGRKSASPAAEQERRLQRLLEIVDELADLTDWKKL